MSLKDLIAADVSAVFFNAADFGVSIDYASGGVTLAADIVAIVEASEVDITTGYGRTRSETRDYLIQVSDMSQAPKRGDTITEGSKQYIATSPNNSDVWVYEDQDNLIYRVRTVLKST